MDANNNAIRKALTALVNYLNKEVKRTSKCKRCRYRGKTFRGEPCYWHVDCGIDDSDDEASDNAMYLLKRFKLQEALAAPPRNCDVGTARQQEKRHKEEVCPESACPKHEGFMSSACKGCFAMWSQMPYKEGGAKCK
jgi:hypothetical protein